MHSTIRKFLEARIGAANYDKWEERIRAIVVPGSQSKKAADYWAALQDCEAYFTDPNGRIRSEWIASKVSELGITSMLEVGTNSGRNLSVVRESYPDIPLRGIDVNKMAIEFAKSKNPTIDYAVVDANVWGEGDKSVDAIITMSLIDHIPDESMIPLAKNMVKTAKKYIICFELWDGTDGWRGLYKYSRDLRSIFEPLGVKTLMHEPSVGQYNATQSLLYTYIGEVEGADAYKSDDKPVARKTVKVGGRTHPIETYTDPEGRDFHFVHISRPETKKLLVHFTAFFGDWGDRKEYREHYQGYFHRLRMFGDEEQFSSLFVCDEYGATKNGTYYTGEAGDFFVERATEAIIRMVMERDGVEASSVVTVGSSMGATGAAKFALMLGAKGAIAISPHFDLDICASTQNRMEHVSFIVPDGNAISAENHRYTRQVSNLAREATGALPHLFIHACADDAGVYQEQILPLAALWREKGGVVDLDIRPVGGHTSEFATKPLLVDAVARMFRGERIEALTYRQDPRFWPEVEGAPVEVQASGSDAKLALSTNAELLALAADFAVARVWKSRGQLPALVFSNTVDEGIVAAVRRDPAKAKIASGVRGSMAVDGPTVLVLQCAFYGLTRDASAKLLADIGKADALLVIDQTDNVDGAESAVLTLRDSGDREYMAECHDFRNLLTAAGYPNLLHQHLPQASKSLSGVILADAIGPMDEGVLAAHWQQLQEFDLKRFRGTQGGQFIIPSCAEGGVRIRAFLRNNHRLGEAFPIELRKLGLTVELRVFRHGKLIHLDPAFATIPLDGVQEISDQTCEVLKGDQTGILVVARCFLPSDGAKYFGQEHQLCYVHERTGAVCSVLYDQLPIVTDERPQSPIVLLAPKAWVSSEVNTFVTFPSTNSQLGEGAQSRPMVIDILDEQGSSVTHVDVPVAVNSAYVFDVRKALEGKIDITDAPRFFSVVAKGGASSYAIVTFVVNEQSGNMALEHSLSPHYYVSEGLQRVRADALSNFEVN